LKGETDTPFSIKVRTTTEKTNKKREYLKNPINQLDLTNIYMRT
jgi:hypothetical protein